ncbi:MAG: GNAT family N-acetyltransferase, partial [Saprospiraceae bacterium]
MDDVPLLSALAHRIWRVHYPAIIGMEQTEYMLGLLYSLPALYRQIETEEQTFWIVESAGQSIGFLSVSAQGEGRYFLHKFYLDNKQRGQGLGTLAFGLLLARYPDLQELRLTVNRENFTSINFYFKIDFHIEQCVNLPIGQGFVMTDFQMLW